MCAQDLGCPGPDLICVIAAWPKVRPELRVAILAIVASAQISPVQ